MAPKKKAPAKKAAPKKHGGGGDDTADIAANYGWSKAFLGSHPDLNKVFNKAVDNSWTAQRFVAAVQDTAWFKKHSDSVRQAQYLAKTDPKTYSQRVTRLRDHIADSAGTLGIEVGDKTLQTWAKQALAYGWDESTINNHLANQVNIMGEFSTVGGDLGASEDKLRQQARLNGVKLSDGTMQSWLREIVRGNSTFEEYNQYVSKMAAAAHPNWKTELESGLTVSDIVEPYKQTMAQVLEMNPNDIQLDDNRLRSAMTRRDDKTGDYSSMTMTDFEDLLRKQPEWMKTKNAKETFMNTGSNILKMFGVSGS